MDLLLILTGIILFVVGVGQRKRNGKAIVVTGTVVSMRMEVERRYIRGFIIRRFFCRYYYGNYATRFGDDTVSCWYGNPVTVYKPIVRFAYLGGEQEAVVDDASEYKPELNMPMQIAFLPKNPKKAWRPSKDFLWSDILMFLGVVLVFAGVLTLLGFVPFLSGDAVEQAVMEW